MKKTIRRRVRKLTDWVLFYKTNSEGRKVQLIDDLYEHMQDTLKMEGYRTVKYKTELLDDVYYNGKIMDGLKLTIWSYYVGRRNSKTQFIDFVLSKKYTYRDPPEYLTFVRESVK